MNCSGKRESNFYVAVIQSVGHLFNPEKKAGDKILEKDRMASEENKAEGEKIDSHRGQIIVSTHLIRRNVRRRQNNDT